MEKSNSHLTLTDFLNNKAIYLFFHSNIQKDKPYKTMKEFVDSLSQELGNFMPDAIAAVIILLLGIVLCGAVRKGLCFLLSKAKLNERLNKEVDKKIEVEKPIATFTYYLLLLYVLLMVLSVLGIEDALQPLERMLEQFVSYIPSMIAAGVIGFAGFFIARIVSVVVGVAAKGLDKLSAKTGFGETLSFSKIIQQIVFLFIFIPILIAALNALKIKTISEPATAMLTELLVAIPEIIGSAIIITVFYIVGRFIATMLADLLKNLGVDNLPEKLGLKTVFGDGLSLSKLTGHLVFFFIMFTAIISALEKLQMVGISEVLSSLLVLAGQIVLGLVILAFGNFLSNIAYKALSKVEGATAVAVVARYAILIVVLAIGLDAMGIADTIVNLAFGLSFGAVAVTVALSFGLGGREAAGKQMEYILAKFRKD